MSANISYSQTSMEEINIDTCIEFEMPTNEYEIWQTILIAFVWIALETIGNGLLLALIHFYKYGGDPLKWRIVDHVSFNFFMYEFFVCHQELVF